MKAKLYSQDGKEKGAFELPVEVFGAEVNQALLHLVIKSYLANQRQGTSKTKKRSEVSGGGKKPWKQKGTGRARSGSNTSPLWVRGAKAFGASNRVYGGTIPKKMRKAALVSALSSRAGEEKILVIETFSLEKPQTKAVEALLKNMSIYQKKNLLVVDSADRNIYLSGRNIKNVQIKAVVDLNAYDILSTENIVFSSESLVSKIKEVVAQ